MGRRITQLEDEMGNPATRCWMHPSAVVICVLLLSVLVLIGCASGAPATPTPGVGATPTIAPSPLPTLSPTKAPQPVAVTPATIAVDDAVNAILAGVSDEQALFADAEKDAELITADSQALSDFGQSYNENES